MRRLRETWLALGGSALIIALSVTGALAADPAIDAIDNIGQRVSEFTQGLQNETANDSDAEEQSDLDEDEQLADADEDAGDTAENTLAGEDEADEATDEELEPGDEGYDWANHGECVSWHAHQDENADSDDEASDEEGSAVDEVTDEVTDEPLEPGDEGYQWRNHGEFVSYAARVICRALGDEEEPEVDEEAAEEADPEEEADDELEPGDDGYEWANHGECVSWHAHQKDNNGEVEWRNHGAYVSNAAQTTCRDLEGNDEDTEDADEADGTEDEEGSDAKAERKADKADRKAERKAAKRNEG